LAATFRARIPHLCGPQEAMLELASAVEADQPIYRIVAAKQA
jgi:hypothetical protein